MMATQIPLEATEGRSFLLVGRRFVLPSTGRAFVKCDGCLCNFVENSSHVSFSADCDDARIERIQSQRDDR